MKNLFAKLSIVAILMFAAMTASGSPGATVPCPTMPTFAPVFSTTLNSQLCMPIPDGYGGYWWCCFGSSCLKAYRYNKVF